MPVLIMKKITLGIIAHVDAGKTTLSEALLYISGKIKKQGRVDHGDTYLDNNRLERERGITIFSKQALFTSGDTQFCLLDTPGHADFSAETERTFSVLDYAVLVISGSEGVQAHTTVLWELLREYGIPTFIFVTKMDLAGADKASVMKDLTSRLSPGCVDFESPDAEESIAMCDDSVFEEYMEHGKIFDFDIRHLISNRRLFPVFFGSGLRLEGVETFLNALNLYTTNSIYGEAFSARVFKIKYDQNGTKLSFLKVTGGSLAVRDTVKYRAEKTDEVIEEKITGIRQYSGIKFDTLDKSFPGDVVAVTGLTETYAGIGLGELSDISKPVLEPVMTYKIALPKDTDPKIFYRKLKVLEEEEPLLHLVWNERFSEIHAQLMGQIQTEVITSIIDERFETKVSFEDGRILYRETVNAPAYGVGHFEPLRHYAEVHLLIEPLPAGSGIKIATTCSEDFLDRNWQRLIMTHIGEKQHLGVLTGSPLTDVRITLITGKAHLKHTVGGDFREAVYRAIRQGLMTARENGLCVLLEPYYSFRLEIPTETVGRAITDILGMSGTYSEGPSSPGISVLEGKIPVSTGRNYAKDVAAYTHGTGRFSCTVCGYYPCHNSKEVIEGIAYDPEADVPNSPDSVFCSHGAGVIIPWYNVPEYMHLEAQKNQDSILTPEQTVRHNISIEEKEIEAIMEREFGPIRRPVYGENKNKVVINTGSIQRRSSLYIVDGYNVIFSWDELAAIAKDDLEGSRNYLLDILANYQAFTGREIIVVFDAYNVKGSVERKFDYHGLHVVYTKEDELGDTYIEKLIYEIGKDYSVRAVTSDGLIQLQAVRSGVMRLSAREFREEILAVDKEIKDLLEKMSANK